MAKRRPKMAGGNRAQSWLFSPFRVIGQFGRNSISPGSREFSIAQTCKLSSSMLDTEKECCCCCKSCMVLYLSVPLVWFSFVTVFFSNEEMLDRKDKSNTLGA